MIGFNPAASRGPGPARSGQASRLLGLLLAPLLALAGCTSTGAPAVPNGTPHPGAGGDAGRGSCLHDEPGCACSHEGEVIQCGTPEHGDGGVLKCDMGGQICNNGTWSSCQTNSNDPAIQSGGLKVVTGVEVKGLAPAAGESCANNPCDPYCRQYPDTAADAATGDGGTTLLGCGDAAVITVVTQGVADASVAPPSVLADAALADGEGYIYIVLPTGQTTQREFTTPQAAVTHADIYFLLDDTSSMGAASSNLASALTSANGIITEIKALLPSGTTDFGVGRFEDFYQLPYIAAEPTQLSSGPEVSGNSASGSYPNPVQDPYNLPYQNLLSLQSDLGAVNPLNPTGPPTNICGNTWPASCTAAAVTWSTDDAFNSTVAASQVFARSGGDIPEASVAALFQTATGFGLYNGIAGSVGIGPGWETAGGWSGGTWWQVPREYWMGTPLGNDSSSAAAPFPFTAYPSDQYTGNYVPCGAGTVTTTYPCFHLNATPVVVLMSDAPAHEGPGGQYPHVAELMPSQSPNLAGANLWPVQPVVSASSLIAGTNCPASGAGGVSYDAPVQTGTGSTATTEVCSLTANTQGTNTGTSFATAIPLPVGPNGLPVPGVYYGQVSNSGRAPSSGSPSDWYSASSVGGGVFTIASIPAAMPGPMGFSPFAPGGHVRSSLRDCSAGDETECTPGVNMPSAPPPTCYNDTSGTGATRTYEVISTQQSGQFAEGSFGASATLTYAAAGVESAASQVAPTSNPTSTEPALAGSLIVANTLTGGPTAVTKGTGANAASTAYETTAGTAVATTETSDTYNLGAVQTLVSFYQIDAGTQNTTISPNISIPAGDTLTNLKVIIDNMTQGVSASVTASVTIGMNSYLGTAPALTSTTGTSSSSGGVYTPNSGSTTASVVINQADYASQSNSNYIYVTVTYQLGTPAACPVGASDGPILYPATVGTSPAQCQSCTTTWNGAGCADSCSTGTLGTGAAGTTTNTTTCYYCPAGSSLSTPASSAWSCSTYCPTAGYTLATNGNTNNGADSCNGTSCAVGQCYSCSDAGGTLSTGIATWTCSYAGACSDNGTIAQQNGTNVTAGNCYACEYSGTIGANTATVYTAPTGTGSYTANWTCTGTNATSADACSYPTTGYVGAWTLEGGAGGTCYNCTVGTFDITQGGAPYQCSTCPPASPAYDKYLDLIGGKNYCVGCASGELDVSTKVDGAAALPECVTATAACSAGWAGGSATGTHGQFTAVTATTATFKDTTAAAFTASDVGAQITISNSTVGANDGTWVITVVNSTTSVTLANVGVTSSTDTAVDHWSINTCTMADACNTTGAGAGYTTTADGIWTGVNCANGTTGTECSPDTLAGAAAETQNCYLLETGQARDAASTGHGGCFCQLMDYTAGTGGTTYSAGNPPPCAACMTGTNTITYSGTGETTNANGATCAINAGAGVGYAECQCPAGSSTASCSMSGPANSAGDGYYGNDIIYKFTVPSGSGFGARYYYHFALLAYGPDSTSTWATGGSPGGGTSVQSNVKPFLYLKAAPGTSINTSLANIDSSYPFTIPTTAAASDDSGSTGTFGGTVGGANGPVLDCNKSAHNQLLGPSPDNDSYVLSTLDGYLAPGTYYLVVDNAAPTSNQPAPPAFQYFLQVNGFDDAPSASNPPTYTQPSYNQMITALNAIQAKFVGVENSGISCLRPGDTSFWSATSTAQFETRDWMEKAAYDTGSYDATTVPIRPYVVPVRKDGTSCNPPCNTAALTAVGLPAMVTNAVCSMYCSMYFPDASGYDSNAGTCTPTCTTNNDCPMDAPNCSSGICTSGCAGGVSGLACAVAAAVSNLTANLKQNIYLRPIPITAGSSYAPPGASCSTSATCNAGNGGPYCYGGTCSIACTAGGGQCGMSLYCVPSTIPNDTNYGYCVSPSVFIKSVEAVSTDSGAAMPPTGSDAVCGIHPNSVPCTSSANCPSNLPACLTSGPGQGYCGISDTGPDTVTPQPPYYIGNDPPQNNDGMFNLCSPGAEVVFNVTFTMPFQRSSNVQDYEFDLGIYAGAGIVGRTRVILSNPALEVESFYRDYNGLLACGGQSSGSHVVWGNFSWAGVCPTDEQGDYSQIRFCASTFNNPDGAAAEVPSTAMDTQFDGGANGAGGGGCAPGEVLLAVATSNPNPASQTSGGWYNSCQLTLPPGMGYSCAPTNPTASTPAAAWATCTALTTKAACTGASSPMVDGGGALCSWAQPEGVNVGAILQAAAVARGAGTAQEPYLRIRMEFDPSIPGDVVSPFLSHWNLDIDCIPSE